MKVVVIGGGLAGLAAARRLSDTMDVVLVDDASELGGVLSSYDINGYHIEKYYHHLFQSDTALIDLIHELGLGERLQWVRGTTGYFINGRINRMNTPLEIMKYEPFSLIDVARLAIFVLRSKMIRDPGELDDVTAKEWILKSAGSSVYENFFAPLLASKFGDSADRVSAAWLVGRVTIRSNRGLRGERLGYIRGGFQQLIDALAKKLTENGGTIRRGTVDRILVSDGKVRGVRIGRETIESDVVISTVSPHVLSGLVDASQLGLDLDIRYQGTACALFGLSGKVMDDTYWLNIKADVPFGAVIEHTNFLPISDYGEHLMYVTAYFQDAGSPLCRMRDGELISFYMEGLERMFLGFRDKVKWTRLARASETAPVYETGYRNKVLPYETGIRGLYLAGMFSSANYPERSMNGSLVAGFECADIILAKCRN